MLDRAHRLTSSSDFALALRRGRRAGTPTLVLHLAHVPCAVPGTGTSAEEASRPARVGLVVGRAVGGAVVRNRVKRRLRHLVRG